MIRTHKRKCSFFLWIPGDIYKLICCRAAFGNIGPRIAGEGDEFEIKLLVNQWDVVSNAWL